MERWGWRALGAAGRVLGPRAGRCLAAVVLRARAPSEAGWLEGVHRLAARPRPGAPELTRLPEAWWAALLERGGYQPTGQILPVANQVYRPRATTRPPVPSTR